MRKHRADPSWSASPSFPVCAPAQLSQRLCGSERVLTWTPGVSRGPLKPGRAVIAASGDGC